MNELDLISRLTAHLPGNDSVVVGAGDDCAVLEVPGTRRQLLFKTDAVVEGVHFTPETDPVQVGHKALARCLSDMAAMGGVPGSAVITLGLSPSREAGWVEAVYRGMTVLATAHGVAIVGGETVSCPGATFISVAMVGSVERGKAVLRSGASVGDALLVTGELGGSMEGKHLDFVPRLKEARWLCDRFHISSMIDLSDGLAGDLRHVLQASGVGAELLADAIPVSRAAKRSAAQSHGAKTALVAALGDGEDFELLFTVAASDAVSVLDGWKQVFPEVRLGCIGKIVETPGLHLRDRHGVRPLAMGGYAHFRRED